MKKTTLLDSISSKMAEAVCPPPSSYSAHDRIVSWAREVIVKNAPSIVEVNDIQYNEDNRMLSIFWVATVDPLDGTARSMAIYERQDLKMYDENGTPRADFAEELREWVGKSWHERAAKLKAVLWATLKQLAD